MDYTEKSTIAEVVADDYRAASVFKEHDIDFCCHGNVSLGDACNEKNIKLEDLLSEIDEKLNSSSGSSTDFNSWPIDFLADYIEKFHHKTAEQKISEIKPYLAKIKQVHGTHHPELAEVKDLFDATAGDMARHMKKEELILFPFIRKMIKNKDSGEVTKPVAFGRMGNPIDMLKDDHTEQGDNMKKIRELTNNYTVPEDGCNTYKITLSMLDEFENNLFQHIHLENNILFPKTLEMEKGLQEV